MVNELLDLARMESGQLQLKMRPVDLSQLLTDVHHSQQAVSYTHLDVYKRQATRCTSSGPCGGTRWS